MKATLSHLQVKEVVIKKCRIEENLTGIPKSHLNLDFDLGITEDGLHVISLKLNYNKNTKKPVLKVDVEADFFFEIDPELPEERRARLLIYNGLSISYSFIRGLVFQKCCMLPPTMRILPTINLLPIIERKFEDLQGIEED